MTPISFLHANTKREVCVTREQVFAIQYSAAHGCTHIISLAGAIVPVSESVEKAKYLVYGTSKYNASTEANTVPQGAETAKEAEKNGA